MDFVLFLDDEPAPIRGLMRSLSHIDDSIAYRHASTLAEAQKIVHTTTPLVLIVDLNLDPEQGPESGLAAIATLHKQDPTTRILALTGHDASAWGVKALQHGASSFLSKPADTPHLFALIRDGIACAKLKRAHLELQNSLISAAKRLGFSSRSPAMTTVLERLDFAASNNQSVLLLGETGTGKSELALALHRGGTRASKPFIRLQPETNQALVNSELFGHTKGAFTGAVAERRGLIECANGGTLFIDEVDLLPHETQVMLLHVLQEKKFRPLGSNSERQSDFRLICASNRPAKALVGPSALRQDFYHRIAHCLVQLPALRERREDIPFIAQDILVDLINREQLSLQGFSEEALSSISLQPWPGNIRELQACVEGAAYRAQYHQHEFIQASDLDFQRLERHTGEAPPAHTGGGGTFHDLVQQYELKLVEDALQISSGNQSKAALALGLNRVSLRRILARQRNK